MVFLKLSPQKHDGANYQVLGDSGVEAGLAGKEEALPTRLQKKMKVFMG